MRKLNRSHNRQYMCQKKNARRRNIPWEFTYDTWFEVWVKSGHLDQRGSKRGQYCMSRYNDTGPYSPTNVFIQLITSNTRDGRIGKKHTIESRKQMSSTRKLNKSSKPD